MTGGESGNVAAVETKMPKVVKKRRKIDEDGSMEECACYLHGRVAFADKQSVDFDLIFQDVRYSQKLRFDLS